MITREEAIGIPHWTRLHFRVNGGVCWGYRTLGECKTRDDDPTYFRLRAIEDFDGYVTDIGPPIADLFHHADACDGAHEEG